MKFDDLCAFDIKARSCKWRLRFVKVLDVRHERLADFLLWLAPKVGLRAVLDSVVYEHVTASGCHFGIGAHYTPCETSDD